MRYLGAVKTLKQAKKDAERVSKQSKKTIVIKKQKVQSPGGKWGVGYHIWADMSTKKPQVLMYDQWQKKKKVKK